MNSIKQNILVALGLILPGGFSIYTLVEKLMPYLQMIGFLVSIGVGVTVILINYRHAKKIKMDIEINELKLKHAQDVNNENSDNANGSKTRK